jgi:hypothetical protein
VTGLTSNTRMAAGPAPIDASAGSAHSALIVILAAVAAIGGTVVAFYYHRLGLTLSHYDARGHLVVARRIFDSITPGWQQIGAVWLPLPHLLNAIPVQVDSWYRTGASAVAISVASFAIAAGAVAWIAFDLTGSIAATLAGAAVFAFNPNVLYLQATPMTEPLLLALATLATALLINWCRTLPSRPTPSPLPASPARPALPALFASPAPPAPPVSVGLVFALACLTRYEAWPVTGAALAAAAWTRWRTGEPLSESLRLVARIAAYPAVAVVGFGIFSRVVVGSWFVGTGFFVPENKALGSAMMSAAEIWFGLRTLSGTVVITLAAVGAIVLLVGGVVKRASARALIALSLAATAAVPWVAFLEGHPFRVRYMVPLVAAEAIGVAAAVEGIRRVLVRAIAIGVASRSSMSPGRAASAIVMLFALPLIAYELRPLDRTAPMVVEAQWDRPNMPVRDRVTACLGRPKPGEKIMASMGSLGHYMQEASLAGFHIGDFLHEGNGDIWLAALAGGPRPFADWVVIEEKAEGGDMLAVRARTQPHFLDGYTRVCDGAGLALYRRDVPARENTETNGTRRASALP